MEEDEIKTARCQENKQTEQRESCICFFDMGKTGNEQRLKVVLRIRNNGGWEEFDHQERKLQRVKALPFFSHFLQISLKKKQKRGKKHQRNKKIRKAKKPQGPGSKAP